MLNFVHLNLFLCGAAKKYIFYVSLQVNKEQGSHYHETWFKNLTWLKNLTEIKLISLHFSLCKFCG